MFSKMLLNWRIFLENNRNKQNFLFTFLFTVVNVLMFTWFMRVNEHRIGIQFTEPLLEFILPVTDFTWEIFIITYGSILLGVAILISMPFDFLKTLQAYNLLIIFRLISIGIFPLEPSSLIIPMKDPIIETLAAYDGFIYKDLFFSGHTATLFLLGLTLNNNWIKAYFYITTFIVAFMLVKQQVHYSIDVLAAPIFAYICYYLIELFWKRKETLQTQSIERH
jgi:hypothetical protein